MTAKIDVYYDFRSPYAYFAAYRIRQALFLPPVPVDWRWRPVSVDILLNLQAGRDPWAPYVDPLSTPKRRHLVADVRRYAAFYGAPLRPPRPPRPDSITALCAAYILDRAGAQHEEFRNLVFDALWHMQRDIADEGVLAECLTRSNIEQRILDEAATVESRSLLADETRRAYDAGIFGVPSFVLEDELFFGNDRLDMLSWRLRK